MVTHPGAILREDILPTVGLSEVKVASLLGISCEHLRDILAERVPMTRDVAARVGELWGGGDVWARMQAAYDAKALKG